MVEEPDARVCSESARLYYGVFVTLKSNIIYTSFYPAEFVIVRVAGLKPAVDSVVPDAPPSYAKKPRSCPFFFANLIRFVRSVLFGCESSHHTSSQAIEAERWTDTARGGLKVCAGSCDDVRTAASP